MLNFHYFILSFLFVVNLLNANDVAYDLQISNANPYEKEAIFLEVNLTQVDQSKVMLFKFSLKKSDDYEFHQIGFKEYEKYHDLRHEYLYLIYPKTSGKVLLEFEMRKSITDDDKVAYSISGDRDNVKGLEKKDIKVDIIPIPLEVKNIPTGTDLVGDFTLTEKLDKINTEAYNPVNLKVFLTGQGHLSSFKLLKKSDAYKLFTQNPKFKIFHTVKGSSSSLEWDYAISAKESFTLAKHTLKAFNPLSQKTYELVLPAYKINVKQVDTALLLDKENYPPKSKGIDWDFWSEVLSYVLVFLAGFLVPRDIFKTKNVLEETSQERLKRRIKEATTHKALLKLLLLENDNKYKKSIEALEGVVYNGAKKSLSSIKNNMEY
ncbi:MAG: Unknown protein [uncultured Sulfurovum sp.]|uniref:BatD n=1 Tax=uncultured Sulfurovum sp. TaxID=269237 RepID=A0A6S6SKM7_9BACT|nr:MAG: Unknown protein [uncultured Sulfurovum sp.]